MDNMESRIKQIICSVIFTTLLIAGCSDSSKVGKDGYKFENKEYEKLDLEISFVLLQDQAEFNEQAKIWAPGVEGLQAFSRLQPKVNRCIIYIKDPDWKYEPEWIGHEVSHCVWGRWHEKINAKQASEGHRPENLPLPDSSL